MMLNVIYCIFIQNFRITQRILKGSCGGSGSGGGEGGGGSGTHHMITGYRSRMTGGTGGVSLRAAGEQDTHVGQS